MSSLFDCCNPFAHNRVNSISDENGIKKKKKIVKIGNKHYLTGFNVTKLILIFFPILFTLLLNVLDLKVFRYDNDYK